MAVFKYVATDEAGNNIKGKMDVNSEVELQAKLQESGKYLVSCSEGKEKKNKQLKAKVLADFARQIGSLIGAGVSLVRALTIIADEEGIKPELKEVYTAILRSVRRGNPLSNALEEQGELFPTLMVYMFRAAETSGNLELTAVKMADQYEKDDKLSMKVKSAFTYPKVLMVLICAVIGIIMGYVMPQFKPLFDAMPSLPIATQVLFGLSNLVTKQWYILIIIVVVAIFLVKNAKKVPSIVLMKDKMIMKMPIVGKLMKTIYTARFSRTLSSLYSCGISIVSALQIARNVIGNKYIEQQFDNIIPFVRSGNPLSEGLGKVDGFVKKLPASVRVGEESGNLEDLLINMADNFDYESEVALSKLVSYLEPAMIIVMAVVVGFIVVGVIMPIYDSYSYIG